MPSDALRFRPVCGAFPAVYCAFMLKRAKFKAAMKCSVLTLRTRGDGVTLGLLLSLFLFGPLLLRAGDLEQNPGPPKPDKTRQTRLDSASTRRDSVPGATGKESATAGESSSVTDQSTDPSLKDMMKTMMGSMNGMQSGIHELNSKFDKMSDDMEDLKGVCSSLKGEVSKLRQEVADLKTDNTKLKSENERLTQRVDYLDKKVVDLEGRSKRNNVIIHAFLVDLMRHGRIVSFW